MNTSKLYIPLLVLQILASGCMSQSDIISDNDELQQTRYNITFYSIKADTFFHKFSCIYDVEKVFIPSSKEGQIIGYNSLRKDGETYPYCYEFEMRTKKNIRDKFFIYRPCLDSLTDQYQAPYLMGKKENDDWRLYRIELDDIEEENLRKVAEFITKVNPKVYYALHMFDKKKILTGFDRKTAEVILEINQELRPFHIDKDKSAYAYYFQIWHLLEIIEKCENDEYENGRKWLHALFDY